MRQRLELVWNSFGFFLWFSLLTSHSWLVHVLVFIFLALPPDTNPASYADINNIQIRQQRHQLCCLPTSTVLTYLTVESMGHYRFLFFCCSCCRWKVAGEPANGFHCKWLCCSGGGGNGSAAQSCCRPRKVDFRIAPDSQSTSQPDDATITTNRTPNEKVNNECCLLCFLFLFFSSPFHLQFSCIRPKAPKINFNGTDFCVFVVRLWNSTEHCYGALKPPIFK